MDVQKVRQMWACQTLCVQGHTIPKGKDFEALRQKTKELYKRYVKEKKEDKAKKVIEAFEIIKDSLKHARDKLTAAQKRPSDGSIDDRQAKRANGGQNGGAPSGDKAAPRAAPKPPAKDGDRFRRLASRTESSAFSGGSAGLLQRSGSAMVCSTCGQTCYLMEIPNGSFSCPACRVRSMDPFNGVLEGRKGLLKVVMMDKYMVKDSWQDASFKLKFNLPNLQAWRKAGHNVELRMCSLETVDPKHRWPNSLVCKVNGRNAFEIKPPAAGHKRRDVPVRISPELRSGANTLEVKMQDIYAKRFVLALVRTSPVLPKQMLKEVKVLSEEQSKNKVTELIFTSKLESTGEEVYAEGSDRCRLICPITLSRLETPVRGHRCRHLQCFDLKAYLISNLRMAAFNQRWRCPVCDITLKPPKDLFVDVFLLRVLAKTEAQDEEVAFDDLGDWRVTARADEALPPSSDEEEAGVPDHEDDCVLQQLVTSTLADNVGDDEQAAPIDEDDDDDAFCFLQDPPATPAPEIGDTMARDIDAAGDSASAPPAGSPSNTSAAAEASGLEMLAPDASIDEGIASPPDLPSVFGEVPGGSPEASPPEAPASLSIDGLAAPSPDAADPGLAVLASPEALSGLLSPEAPETPLPRGSSRMACLAGDDVEEDDGEIFDDIPGDTAGDASPGSGDAAGAASVEGATPIEVAAVPVGGDKETGTSTVAVDTQPSNGDAKDAAEAAVPTPEKQPTLRQGSVGGVIDTDGAGSARPDADIKVRASPTAQKEDDQPAPSRNREEPRRRAAEEAHARRSPGEEGSKTGTVKEGRAAEEAHARRSPREEGSKKGTAPPHRSSQKSSRAAPMVEASSPGPPQQGSLVAKPLHEKPAPGPSRDASGRAHGDAAKPRPAERRGRPPSPRGAAGERPRAPSGDAAKKGGDAARPAASPGGPRPGRGERERKARGAVATERKTDAARKPSQAGAPKVQTDFAPKAGAPKARDASKAEHKRRKATAASAGGAPSASGKKGAAGAPGAPAEAARRRSFDGAFSAGLAKTAREAKRRKVEAAAAPKPEAAPDGGADAKKSKVDITDAELEGMKVAELQAKLDELKKRIAEKKAQKEQERHKQAAGVSAPEAAKPQATAGQTSSAAPAAKPATGSGAAAMSAPSKGAAPPQASKKAAAPPAAQPPPPPPPPQKAKASDAKPEGKKEKPKKLQKASGGEAKDVKRATGKAERAERDTKAEKAAKVRRAEGAGTRRSRSPSSSSALRRSRSCGSNSNGSRRRPRAKPGAARREHRSRSRSRRRARAEKGGRLRRRRCSGSSDSGSASSASGRGRVSRKASKKEVSKPRR